MSSPAGSKYIIAAGRIRTLRITATDMRLRPMSHDEIQVYYHAALAAYVAAWEAYVNNLVRDFYTVIAHPFDRRFQSIYTIAQQTAKNALERFNTPNWENTRGLFVEYTGYDPIADWVWPRRGVTNLQVHERLNEILRVRHSFAHGFDMPACNWTQSPSGRVRLTGRGIQEIEAFFRNLVKATDKGMKAHILQTYGIATVW